MVEEQTDIQEGQNKPQQGAWDNMQAAERKPKVEFEMNKTVNVIFPTHFEKPAELPSQKDGSVFYIFGCNEGGTDKVIMTSAWSLLQGLKANMPLAGKTVSITKTMKDGKQHYKVEGNDEPKVDKTFQA